MTTDHTTPTVLVVVDEENGCDRCWNRFEWETGLSRYAIPDAEPVRVPAASVRPCEHGAPESAPSIFIRVTGEEEEVPVWTCDERAGRAHLLAATHGFWAEMLCGERLHVRRQSANPPDGERCPRCVWLSGESDAS